MVSWSRGHILFHGIRGRVVIGANSSTVTTSMLLPTMSGFVHGQEIHQRAGMNAEHDRSGDGPARKLARVSIVVPTQRGHAHFACRISRPTRATFRYRAARSSFITAITSP